MSRPPKGSEKWNPKYCDELIEHMREGYSFSSFGANCNCTVQTLKYWCEKYPEFAHAKAIGEVHNLKHWEKLSHSKMDTGKWIFNMKNRFGWMDKREVTQNVNARLEGAFDRKALLEAVKKDPFMKDVIEVEAKPVEVKEMKVIPDNPVMDVGSTPRKRKSKKQRLEEEEDGK
jgi:hypothetical protein